MAFINIATWNRYKSIINEVAEDFNEAIVVFYKNTVNIQRHGEGVSSGQQFTQINVKCLISFNYFRTWPTTKDTNTGALDKESMVLIFNNDYLNSINLINAHGNFDIEPGIDYFEYQGVFYEPSGETPVSHAHDIPLHTYVIVKRKPVDTASKVY